MGDDLGNFVVNHDFVGLGARGIGWAFTTKTLGVYQPLSWLVLEAQRSLFALDPRGYHIVSLLLHGINCAILYFLVLALLQSTGSKRLQTGRWQNLTSAFAVALFAVHPLRAEVVVWVSCQPYLVCAFFLLLSAYVYLKQGKNWLRASLALFLMALLSKAVALMFPILLILMDIYPLQRVRSTWKEKWKEKLPFLTLTVLFMGISFWARSGFGGAGKEYGLVAKITTACYGITFFLWKSVVPSGLAGFYPMPSQSELLSSRLSYLPIGIVLAITGFLIYYRRRFFVAALVWAGYIAFLLPNLGLFSFSNSITADRYSYAATLGWAALIAAGLGLRFPERWQKIFHRLLPPTMVCVISVLFLLSWRQDETWKDNVAFWTHVFNHGGEKSDLANFQLGLALAIEGKAGVVALHQSLTRAESECGRKGQALERCGYRLERE